MSKIVDRMSADLASRSSRRGFLGRIARVSAVIGVSAFGLVGLEQEAAAYDVVCCTLASAGRCPTCPNCPASYDYTYYWACCYGGCRWYCRDCEQTSTGSWCSCYWTDNVNCNGICSFHPAP